MSLDGLHSHVLQDSLSEDLDLLYEFWTQVSQVTLVQVLQFVFIGKRPDHGLALSLLEIPLESTSNLVLRVITGPLLGQGTFQILLRGKRNTLLVDKL